MTNNELHRKVQSKAFGRTETKRKQPKGFGSGTAVCALSESH